MGGGVGFPGLDVGGSGGGRIKAKGGEGGGEMSREGDPRRLPEEIEGRGVDEVGTGGRWCSGMAKVLGSIFSVRSDSNSSKGSCSHGP